MIALSENQLERIESRLRTSISEIDTRICNAEQALQTNLNLLKLERGDLDRSPVYQALTEQLHEYGQGVRLLRTNLAKLERETHDLVSPSTSHEDDTEREDLANKIQKETHDTPASFTDFVKGLLMWTDTPSDRMKS